MTATPHFPADQREFAELVRAVSAHVETTKRLPDWPFRAPTGFVTVYEYDVVLGGSFGRVLGALAEAHHDEWIGVLGLAPEVAYYRDGYDLFPAFRAEARSIRDGYAEGMQHEPGGDPTGAFGVSLNVLAITGSSGAWAVWAQRDWEIGLLLTSAPEGPWLATDVPWFGRDVDLSSIRSPEGWGVALSDEALTTFQRNVAERGIGPASGESNTGS